MLLRKFVERILCQTSTLWVDKFIHSHQLFAIFFKNHIMLQGTGQVN